MANKPPRVVQKIVGRSRRSLRMTKTARAGQRYLIFAEKDSNSELEFPESVNDLRSYIYTYSVISNDVTNIVPSKTLRKINSANLKLGRMVGDYNAIRNTIKGLSKEHEVSGIGQRALRRAGGRISGSAMRIIPSGDSVFTRAAFRGVRSVAGANLTMFTDNMLNKLKPGEASSRMVTDKALRKLAKKGELGVDYMAAYVELKLKENTPIDSGALYASIKNRKGRGYGRAVSGGSKAAQKIVSIGDVPNMPDPRVPYPWVVEFGINNGFDRETQHLNTRLGGDVPNRFKFLSKVTGPRPEGDNYFGGFYNNDNRAPMLNRKDRTKGAMMRRALNKVIDDFKRSSYGRVGVAQKDFLTFDQVWNAGEKYSTRSTETPF